MKEQEHVPKDPCHRKTYSMAESTLSQLEILERELYGLHSFNKSQVIREAIFFYYTKKILLKKEILQKEPLEMEPHEDLPLEPFEEGSLLGDIFEKEKNEES